MGAIFPIIHIIQTPYALLTTHIRAEYNTFHRPFLIPQTAIKTKRSLTGLEVYYYKHLSKTRGLMFLFTLADSGPHSLLAPAFAEWLFD
jgi:hypothetical protein